MGSLPCPTPSIHARRHRPDQWGRVLTGFNLAAASAAGCRWDSECSASADSYRGGTLAEYVAIEARNLAPLPGDVDFTAGASVAMPGLTAWQGLFEHGRLQGGAEHPRARRGRRSRFDGDAART